MPYFLCLSFLFNILFQSFVISLLPLWFSFSCLYLFLLVFLVSSSFVVNCSLSKCGLLWHLSLEAHPIHKRGLVKEGYIFLEWFERFYIISASYICFSPCFSNFVFYNSFFFVFLCFILSWLIFLVENHLSLTHLKKHT